MKKDEIIEIVLVALGIVLTFGLLGVILFSSGCLISSPKHFGSPLVDSQGRDRDWQVGTGKTGIRF